MARVFLLEDHSWFRKALADLLGLQPDREVVAHQAGSLAEARREADEMVSKDASVDEFLSAIRVLLRG